MKTFKNCAAQGDLLIRRIDKLPEGVKEERPKDEKYIVAHSETGHHHTVNSQFVKYYIASQLLAYMEVEEPTVLEHHRSWDKHEALQIPTGVFEIRRQREYTPEGWRRVED